MYSIELARLLLVPSIILTKKNSILKFGWGKKTERGNILSLSLFHKIHLHETRPLIRTCMPKLDLENTCPTRSKGGYIPQRYTSSSFEKSFLTILWKFGTLFQKISNTKNFWNINYQSKRKWSQKDMWSSRSFFEFQTTFFKPPLQFWIHRAHVYIQFGRNNLLRPNWTLTWAP